MTDDEFDNSDFCSTDEIVVRKYFGTERMKVEYVNFVSRTVNGYTAAEIIEHIKIQHDEQQNFY